MNINESTYLSVLIHMLSLSPYPAGLKSKEGIFEYTQGNGWLSLIPTQLFQPISIIMDHDQKMD